METEKLYYQDPYLTAFTARVLSCEKSKSGWAVVLDRTAFYPEGADSRMDHGTLGAVQVTDVHETNGVIFHTCDGPVEIGAEVEGPSTGPAGSTTCSSTPGSTFSPACCAHCTAVTMWASTWGRTR